MKLNKEAFKTVFVERLQESHGKSLEESTVHDRYETLAGMARDMIGRRWVATNHEYSERDEKQVYYFSIEFMLGRLLDSNLLSLGVKNDWVQGLRELGVDYDELVEREHEPGLGNGGLGRLAACFLDSLASLGLPGNGCGIRYKYGLFEQKILNGEQVERPDNWLKDGYVWEYRKIDKAVKVTFGDSLGTVLAVPYDIPVIGFNNNTVNTLRLWSAEPDDSEFDLASFNRGDYAKAVEYKYSVEAISEIVYPDDSRHEGRVLRLRQQYFFVSAGLQSIIRFVKRKHGKLSDLHERIAIHINDTHPAVAVAELMRILTDVEGMEWEEAWWITTNTISYTNHTILPEALEKWPVGIFQPLLPRIYEIINEINERYCADLWHKYPGDWDRIGAMAIISNGYVHMANLAVVGSHSVNGVAKIHSEILKNQCLKLQYQYSPYKFNNKTNGVTHRRWLLSANPKLADLITKTIGRSWISHPTDLSSLRYYTKDIGFQQELAAVKLGNKARLAEHIAAHYGIQVDPHSMFDIHVKRIHAYKRQFMNVLRVMELYDRLLQNPDLDVVPRTVIIGGKAAPSYFLAKKVIKFINSLAAVINNDARIKGKLKLVFMENYRVSLAELIVPAADVSEQISTASKEASGTGNMKFMMNGAVTIGTLDGANIEILDEVGDDNIMIFGLKADEVITQCANQQCDPRGIYESDPRIRRVVDNLVNGELLNCSPDEFRPLYDYLVHGTGEFFELQDYSAYWDAQQKIDALYRVPSVWGRMAGANIAHSGEFSSDHTVEEYAIGIWRIHPVVIPSE